MLWAEELWFERWHGRSFVSALDAAEYPTVTAIRSKLEDVHHRQLSYLRGLKPEAVDAPSSYVNFRGQTCEFLLRHMIQHLAAHSSYHRGQLATLLCQAGVEPPHTDYLLFIHSRRGLGT